MIERIKRLFAAAGVEQPASSDPSGQDELHLAAAALLAEVALGDSRFDEVERATVGRLVRTRFGLSEVEAESLVEASERAADDASHLLRFTRVIKDNFSPQERVELIEMLWEVVYADGEMHDYEHALMRRIAGLIYVSDRERGAARKRVLARRALTQSIPA